MIRKYKPKRIIEIGSGFSSCVMLDTNELFFDHKIDLTFIEPYPELLHSLIKESDNQLIKIIPNKIQDVDLTVFKKLEAGDILFIDSTHVSKTYSDVNVIFFDILPRLPKGVIIHIHDIFFPFEYPEEWIREGRSWNEDYLLRAFLQFNNAFKIIFFNDYMTRFFTDELRQNLPLTLKNSGGSIWLEKTN